MNQFQMKLKMDLSVFLKSFCHAKVVLDVKRCDENGKLYLYDLVRTNIYYLKGNCHICQEKRFPIGQPVNGYKNFLLFAIKGDYYNRYCIRRKRKNAE
ncbi:MAG: hypothetical protein HDT39_03510 [Lachnospiraceae bacterium]|nr:hypothetical protein [Lachnospiraceae bacterium]